MIKSVTEYVIEVEKTFDDKIRTSNNIEIFVDKRFVTEPNANIVHTILNAPITKKNQIDNITKGTTVVVNSILLHEFLDYYDQKHSEKTDWNRKTFLLNKQLIYFYKNENDNTWQSANGYVLAKKIEKPKTEIKIKGLYIPDNMVKDFEPNKVLILSDNHINQSIRLNSICNVDVQKHAAPIWIDKEEFLLLKEFHIYGIDQLN